MSIDRRTLLTSAAAAGVLANMTGLIGSASAAPAATPKGGAAGQVFKVGDIVVAAVHDGVATGALAPGFVKNVADPEVAAAYSAIGMTPDKVTNSFTPLLVATSRNLILFDTGFADNGGATNGKLAENLAAIGVKASDIDTVIISHFHGDHINGLRNKAGALVYPNAEIVVPQPEWAFWMDDARMNAAPENGRGGFMGARRVFAPIADKVRRVEWGKEVLPGVTAIQADGHTPGHTAFLIASGKDQMMFVADITNNPAIFARNPDWQVAFDMNGPRAVETRKAMLDRAIADKIRLSFYHAAFPASGLIEKRGAGYELVPVA